MVMKKTIIYFVGALVMISINACKKTLDITNPNGPDQTNFWKTADDALAGVNAIYGNNYRNGLYPRWLAVLTNPRSDDGWGSSGWDQIFNTTNFKTTFYDAEPINHECAHSYSGIY